MDEIRITLAEIDEAQAVFDAALAQIEANLEDPNYSRTAKRKLTITFIFEPNELNPNALDILVSSDVKLPKREPRSVPATMVQGRLRLFDDPTEQVQLVR